MKVIVRWPKKRRFQAEEKTYADGVVKNIMGDGIVYVRVDEANCAYVYVEDGCEAKMVGYNLVCFPPDRT